MPCLSLSLEADVAPIDFIHGICDALQASQIPK